MSESSVQIEFPQPMVEAPKLGVDYFYIDYDGKVESAEWDGDRIDAGRLDSGNVYMTRAEAEQRRAWNAQEMARLVIPAWFRALGADVEIKRGDGWVKFPLDQAVRWVGDWSQEKPENYRARPRDVVVTVNGNGFCWPQTVKEGEPEGFRFIVGTAVIYPLTHSFEHGPTVHHTRAGAESQLAAIRAAAGVVAS